MGTVGTVEFEGKDGCRRDEDGERGVGEERGGEEGGEEGGCQDDVGGSQEDEDKERTPVGKRLLRFEKSERVEYRG